MKKPLVSVLILTYNGLDLLKDCLDSVLKSDYPNLEFVISDNKSSEDIKGFIKKTYPKRKINVYKMKVNKGLTGGFNFGYKYCKGKYVMLLCNDTSIEKNTISELVKTAEGDLKIGAVAPLVTQMKNPQFIHSAGSFLTSYGILYHYGVYQKKNNPIYKKDYYIFSTTGAGFLVRKEACDKTGLYSEDFFMAYDESDLCHRLWLGGYTIVYNHKAILRHKWAATNNPTNPEVWFWNQRNFISSVLINFNLIYAFYYLVMINICFVFWAFISLKRGSIKQSVTLPRAWWWHIKSFNKTLKRRRYVQNKIRQVSDNEIFDKTFVNPSWRYLLLHIRKEFHDSSLPKEIYYS